MRRTDNGTEPTTTARDGPSPGDGLPELSQYERLIRHGIAFADRRGDGVVDHVTARRLAIWFAARPQEPAFARSLVHFVDTGAISPDLKNQLRLRGHSPTHPDQPHAARLLAYCHARGQDVGWVGRNFGAACDQIDRADLMLADMHERALHGRSDPAPPSEADGTQIIALAQANRDTRTVSLILDEATASTVLFAVAAHADEREAHVREVERYGQTLPEGTYGRRNRQAIAARETRIVARLRAVERAYRTAIERGASLEPSEWTRLGRSSQLETDTEIELE